MNKSGEGWYSLGWIAWLFTVGFTDLGFWQAVGALVIWKVDRSSKAFQQPYGDNRNEWYLTMRCGVALPLVPEKINRPWTHTEDALVTCEGCRQTLCA